MENQKSKTSDLLLWLCGKWISFITSSVVTAHFLSTSIFESKIEAVSN